MNEAPLVRLVVPTLGKRLDWLAECLQSVVCQGLPVDVVVVGPPSATGAREIARNVEVCWQDQVGTGLGNAINQGFAETASKYLAWLGDDDILMPGSLLRSTGELEARQDASMVYGRLRCIDANGDFLFLIAPGSFAAKWMRWGHDFVPQPGSLFRRAAVEKVNGLDESLRYAMDLDLFLRLQKVGTVRYLREELASFRRHDTSLTVSNSAPGEEARIVRRRYLSAPARALESLGAPAIDLAGRLWAKGFLWDPRGRLGRHA